MKSSHIWYKIMTIQSQFQFPATSLRTKLGLLKIYNIEKFGTWVVQPQLLNIYF